MQVLMLNISLELMNLHNVWVVLKYGAYYIVYTTSYFILYYIIFCGLYNVGYYDVLLLIHPSVTGAQPMSCHNLLNMHFDLSRNIKLFNTAWGNGKYRLQENNELFEIQITDIM